MVGTTTTPGPRFAPADPSLPHPWRALVDGNTGYIYYWNTETNITQYEKPLPPPTLPVSAGPPHALTSMTSSCPVTGPGTGQGSVPLNDIPADGHVNGHANNGVQVNKLVPKLAAIPVHRGLQGSTGTPAAAQLTIVANGVCPGNVTGPVAFKRGNDGFDYSNQDAYKCPRVQGYSGPGTTLVFDAEAYRRQHEVSVSGEDVPAPFYSFDSAGFPPEMLRELHAAGFSSPTPIQAQSWPIALRGRDIVAIAKTGSGKTLGYLLPAFLHLQHQRNNPRIGPTVLVLAPTRELVTQIQDEAMKFGKSSRITCTCVYGGAPKVQQLRDIERGVDIIIATPGRLNDFLEMKKVSLRQVSYLVLDEADRMLDMGFEPQIRKIVHEVPIRRQTLMYTATWPKEVRKIAADLLVNPVQVNIGNSDELSANKSITQHVEVVLPQEKQRRVEQILRSQDPGAKVIIFCSTKRMCDQLARSLARDFHAAAIHGDKSQTERDWVLSQFRTGKCPVLVATDVAARGLDIKDIRVVINYDFPTGVEDYVHRIGRTGRAGATGLAHTFFSEQDGKYAKELIKVLEGANQKVPQELRDIIARGGGSNRGRGGRWESGGRGGRDGRTGYAGGRGLSDGPGGRGQWNTGNRFGNRDTRHLDMGRERGRDDVRRYMDRERIHRNSRSYSRSRSRSRGRSYSRSRSPSYDRYSNGRARDRSLSPLYGSSHARSPRGISPRHATGISSHRSKSPRRSVSPQSMVYQNRSSYKDSPLRSTSPHHVGSSLHSVSPFKGPPHQRASSPYKAQRLSSPFNSYIANYNSR